MRDETISTPAELEQSASALLEMFPQKTTATVLALHGSLGAGKTAFTQALARILGLSRHVVSPTFLLMRMYDLSPGGRFQKLIHIDAYRVEDLKEMHVLRVDDMFADPGNLVVIEWAEKIAELLPSDTVHLTFSYGEDPQTRILTYGFKEN